VKYLFYSAGGESYWQAEHGVKHGEFEHEYLSGVEIANTRIAPALVARLWTEEYGVTIKCINGRFALPVSYLISRLRRKPFVLWTGIWQTLRTPVHRLMFPLTRYLYRHADAIVTYGEHVKRYLVDQGVKEERIFCAHHAVDNSMYNRPVSGEEIERLRDRLDISSGDRIILYVGRLEEGKGLEVMLRAFSQLKERDVKFVLAGKGTAQARLEQLAKSMGIADRTCFAGYVPIEETPTWYAAAYALVLASVTASNGHRECWGLVVNEAMNQGVPVVASDAVGAAAGGLIKNGENGFIVPEGDVAGLACSLQALLNDTELRERMGRDARFKISSWDNERMVAGFRQAVKYAWGRKQGWS
jgi:glycosyltransferase involved in cell wall biosynthesis